MKRTVMTLALGLALFASGCGGAVEDEQESTATGAYGLEGNDSDGVDQSADDQTTGGVAPDDDPSVEGPTPDPWKAPVSDDGYGTPSPCPDEPQNGAQKTSSSGN